MGKTRAAKPSVTGEFKEVSLGDARLNDRAVAVVECLAARPSESFPKAIGDEGQVEALYRFLSNVKVTLWKLLAPHIAATIARCREAVGELLAVHDTTECSFGGEAKRKGLGRVTGGQGFFVHPALAVDLRVSDGALIAEPLGLLGVETQFRRAPPKKKSSAEQRNTPPEKRESARWRRLLKKVVANLGSLAARVIHVMDREADDYLLFDDLRDKRFVIRSRHDRNVTPADAYEQTHLREWLSEKRGETFREVPLAKRGENAFGASKKLEINRRFPPRQMRTAKLKYRAGTVDIHRPTYVPASGAPSSITLNVVQVFEPNPPKKQQPIEWTLLTSEAIADANAIERVIDIYRARWLIEELFKALKSGCSYEKRQLESAHALMNALGIFLPMAWSLLRMRTLVRIAPNAPADTVLTPTQLVILPHLIRRKLPKTPTVADALFAVAQRGGHLKHNGFPGWQTLGAGYYDLLIAEIGYRAGYAQAKAEM